MPGAFFRFVMLGTLSMQQVQYVSCITVEGTSSDASP